MAPSVLTVSPADLAAQFPSPSGYSQSHTTSVTQQNKDIFHIGTTRGESSTRGSPHLKTGVADASNISGIVYSLKRRSSAELGSDVSSKLLNESHESLQEWIRSQRMSQLPPEGSSYDRVLAWAELFIERLHSFDVEIQEFAGDTYSAAQLSYGYCALMLDVCCLQVPPQPGIRLYDSSSVRKIPRRS